MIKLLTDSIENKLSKITLDYVFFTPHDYVTKIMQGVFSTEEIEHYRILKQWAYHDIISSSYDVINMIETKKVRQAMEYYAMYHDMLLQIPKSEGNLIGNPIIYLHENLSDTQKIRLHLWVEYFQKLKSGFFIQRYSSEKNTFFTDHCGEEVDHSLESLGILNDEEMRYLTRKISNYEELNR